MMTRAQMIRVRALPRSFDAEAIRLNGEPIFCDLFTGREGWDTCKGAAEVEVVVRHGKDDSVVSVLCRMHAHDVARQLEDAIELCDARDLFGSKR